MIEAVNPAGLGEAKRAMQRHGPRRRRTAYTGASIGWNKDQVSSTRILLAS